MKAVNIEYDTDGNDVELPSEITVPDGMIDTDEICDYISEATGFCINGFDIVD